MDLAESKIALAKWRPGQVVEYLVIGYVRQNAFGHGHLYHLSHRECRSSLKTTNPDHRRDLLLKGCQCVFKSLGQRLGCRFDLIGEGFDAPVAIIDDRLENLHKLLHRRDIIQFGLGFLHRLVDAAF